MASTIAQGDKKPHTSSTKLEDQAALAALYVSKFDKSPKKGQGQSQSQSETFLDRDNKLSSAGAAASLKYATAQNLPSYPTSGLPKNDSAAGAAASLGWANQKPFEHWKPDPSSSASAAAMKAKDYKMKELWQPESSAEGAKAALLAHKTGGNVEIWRPEADSPWGNSAATQAFKKFGAGSLSPVLDYGYTDLGRSGSLLAATGAMTQSKNRAIAVPDPTPKPDTYPDESNAVANALNAATSAHKTQYRSDANENGSVPYTTLAREMFTSNPPVGPEVEEKNRANSLHASAVAMAKGMYNLQQKQTAQSSHAQNGAVAAHHRKSSSSDFSVETAPMRYTNLHEAAQKLAQERLAKLHDEHAQNREYRDYYANTAANVQPKQSRLSMRGRARQRASSDEGLDEDTEQSKKIRAQMSLFSSNLSQVDAKKRASDREALLAAAQRNVSKSLHGMDKKVFADTGKVGPSLLSEWEMKAHVAAQAKSDARLENYGKVNIGGGRFVDQSEIDAIARGNVQPVLDEINEKAAAEHERQATANAEKTELARKATEKKNRDKELKANNKKLKQQDKEEEKLRNKEAKEEKKAARTGSTRKTGAAAVISGPEASTEEPVASAGIGEDATEVEAPTTTGTEDATEVEAPTAIGTEDATEVEAPTTTGTEAPTTLRTSTEDQAGLGTQEVADAANDNEPKPLSEGVSPTTKSKSRMSWLKRLSTRSSKGRKASLGEKEPIKEEKGFVGGAALTGASANNSTASLGAGNHESAAIKEVENTAEEPGAAHEAETSATVDPATEIEEPTILPSTETPADNIEEERVGRSTTREEPVSPVSPVDKADDEDDFQEARDNFDEDLAPPPTFPAEKSGSPAREAKFTEVI